MTSIVNGVTKRLLIAVLVALPAAAVADEPRASDLADRYNEEGRQLFGKGELEAAIKKFRAAIAVDPQARFFFNLCFVLNSRYQLEAALGACEAVAEATGADDRLKKRAAELIEIIKKKKAQNEQPPEKAEPIKVTDGSGEPVLESKPLPLPVEPPDDERQPNRVATGPPPRRYPPPIARANPAAAVHLVTKQPQQPERKFHIGVVAGFTFAHVEAQGMLAGSSDTAAGLTGGGFVSTSLSRILVGQAEIVYVERGGSGDNGIDPAGDLSLDYLSFPLIGKVQLPLGRSRLHFDIGFSLSFLVSSSENAPDPSAVDAGFLIGGGITFHRPGRSALIFDLRHESGFTDVVSVDPISVENRTWTLRVGYGF